MLDIITGNIIQGDGYGRKLGFPTVNLEVTSKILPKAGVYSGTAAILETIDDMECEVYRAGIVIDPDGKVEAHLIGYVGDAYGKIAELALNNFLREYKKFNTEEELINQIKKDIEQC